MFYCHSVLISNFVANSSNLFAISSFSQKLFLGLHARVHLKIFKTLKKCVQKISNASVFVVLFNPKKKKVISN